ncbi:MAG: hypothetical protein JW941_06930 [Candidatus Coatesbacteria bacterium]|nr:hypothetical protein [Candidatus Coatesbacteria bacterium]
MTSQKRVSVIASILILFCCGLCLATEQDEGHPSELQAKEAELAIRDLPVHGFYSAGSRWRFTDKENDLDSYTYLSLDVGDPYRNRVSAHVYGRSKTDVLRRREETEYYVFGGIDRTRGLSGKVNIGHRDYEFRREMRLYYGYVDFHRLNRIETIRIGRQAIYTAPQTVVFDGGSLRTSRFESLKSLEFHLFGGIPVHPYESPSAGDSLIGASAEARPWPGGKLRASFLHIEDRASEGEWEDDQFAFSLWHSFGSKVSLHARYTSLSDSDGDVLARVTYWEPSQDFSVQASYYQLLEERDEHATEFDTFYSSLRVLQPFSQARLLLHKGLGEFLMLEAGLDLRKLKDTMDESKFNHEFRRYFVGISLRGAPLEELSLSVNASRWDSRGRSGDSWTIGGDIGYEWGKMVDLSLGTDYSLFKFDYNIEEERDDVRTYYAKVKVRPIEKVTLCMIYDIEDDDSEQYHGIRGELRVTF